MSPMDSDPEDDQNVDSQSTGGNRGGDKPGSGSDVAEAISRLTETVVTLQKEFNTIKSGKDRGVVKATQSLEKAEELLARYEELRSQNVEPQAAAKIIERDRKLEKLYALAEKLDEQSAVKSEREPDRGTVSVEQVVKRFKLPEDDPRVALFAKKQFSTANDAEIAAIDLLREVSSTKFTPADLPADPSSSRVSSSEAEKLQREFDEKKKGLRGDALINLKMDYRSKGLRNIN